MDTQNSIIDKTYDFLDKIDKGIDNLLNCDSVYSVLIIICIIVIAYPDVLDIFNTIVPKSFNISNILPKILFMLVIIYFSRKDMRLAILLSLILLLMIEKNNNRHLNNNIIKLLVNDSKQDEKINELHTK